MALPLRATVGMIWPLASFALKKGRGREIMAVCLLKQRIFEEWTGKSSDESKTVWDDYKRSV
jgi:hypothetical protein